MPSPKAPSTFLLVPDIAARFQLREDTIRRWLRKGRLPALRIGTRWFIDPDALEARLRQEGLRTTEKQPVTKKGEHHAIS